MEKLFLLLGAFQGIIIGIYILSRIRVNPANAFLSIVIFLISIQAFLFSVDEIYEFIGCTLTNILSRLVFFLYGPLIFFYTRAMIFPNNLIKRTDWLHFFPFIFFSVVSFWSYTNWEADNGSGWIHYIANTHYNMSWLYTSLRLLYLLVYLSFSLRILIHYSSSFESTFSNLKYLRINWLKQFILISMIVWIVVSLGLQLNYFNANPGKYQYQFLFIITSGFLYWISFRTLKHPSVFTQSPILVSSPVSKEKYKNSGMSNAEAEAIKAKLLRAMEQEKMYKSGDLQLNDLSEFIGVSRYHLSQVLNDSLGLNFYDFVNGYRVEDAKKLLEDFKGQKMTIEEVAYEVGFNSKSTFIKVFKRYLGCTPGAFKNS